eukprot:10364418-Ditylum_brightwellii.AAC.1
MPSEVEVKETEESNKDTGHLERQIQQLQMEDTNFSQKSKEEKTKLRKVNELLLQEIKEVRESNRNARQILQRHHKSCNAKSPYKRMYSKSGADSEALDLSNEITKQNWQRIAELEDFVLILENKIAAGGETNTA